MRTGKNRQDRARDHEDEACGVDEHKEGLALVLARARPQHEPHHVGAIGAQGEDDCGDNATGEQKWACATERASCKGAACLRRLMRVAKPSVARTEKVGGDGVCVLPCFGRAAWTWLK